MSSRPTSASMLSMLPQPIQPIPGDSFNDRILLLLAAVATTDDMLTYREYQLVQEAAQAIFGERALHAELQAKLHYALLNPPSDPADIARDMANQADAQKVSSTFVDTMLKALSRIGGQEERIDEKARSLVNDIEWAFRKSRLERSAGRGIGLGLNVGESLGELYRKATNVLPSRKEIAGWFAPETSQFNADMERFANSLDRIAWTLDDMDLREELYIFRKMLRRQPFKIVIVGERKRGKSSLINAIIGQELSPVRESTPETATVVEFKYAHAPDYSVRFLDSSQFARLEDYLENEQDNLLLTRKSNTSAKVCPTARSSPASCFRASPAGTTCPTTSALRGVFSGFVARVSWGCRWTRSGRASCSWTRPASMIPISFMIIFPMRKALRRTASSSSWMPAIRLQFRTVPAPQAGPQRTHGQHHRRADQHRPPEQRRQPRSGPRTGAHRATRLPELRPCELRRCRGPQYPAGRRGTLPGRFRLLGNAVQCRVPCPAAESLSSSLPSCGKSWTGMRARRHTATNRGSLLPDCRLARERLRQHVQGIANPCRTPNCSVCWTRTPNSFPPPPSLRWSRPGRS
ncbi:MAG: dynamin family protein [Bilophila wadsworthia]